MYLDEICFVLRRIKNALCKESSQHNTMVVVNVHSCEGGRWPVPANRSAARFRARIQPPRAPELPTSCYAPSCILLPLSELIDLVDFLTGLIEPPVS